ncbi:probable Crossover junction endonuclease MUS81 [Cephalotrichum gorgonifer]|uniref:Crossover junction endonuclease MUS81 n=1 Tax=Cephalotrichum gorgonifer TaxID=2041049 RepID=A0AAE8SRF2_9PEZI|nr:probable Crossover junction endonuclease MUS81 [Cephalotrichum gorgonifer]
MDEPEQCANPLLLGWVKEWLDFAREKNTKGAIVYKHAYDSLKSCPITFQHPSQLQQLKGFGPKLCDRLTDKLRAHCQENGLPMPQTTRRRVDVPGMDNDEPTVAPKKARKKKTYVPTYRSGAYAIILALATLGEDTPPSNGLSKTQLIELAQPMCDSSFTAPSDPTKFYTAWNSIKTLLERDLVYEKGRPLRKYTLTDDGWEVATRINAAGDPGRSLTSRENPTALREGDMGEEDGAVRLGDTAARTINTQGSARHPSLEPERNLHSKNPYRDLIADKLDSAGSSLPTFQPIQLTPGSFTVELLLDVREIRATKDRDYMEEELKKQGVKPIMRSLELGDAQWVAKCHDPSHLSRLGAEGEEIVLDHIVERKRLDDLVASIKDGRFHEQKFRMRKSGVKNVTYIVEEISMDSAVFQRVEEAVTSAMAQIQVVNGYFLKRTSKMDDTIRYLARMTKMLKTLYEDRTLNVIPARVLTAQNYLPLLQHLHERDPQGSYYISYPAFASLASKSDTLTLRDVFLKMLMTTRGVTAERAVEIQKRWRSPHGFVKAFEACGTSEAGRKRKRELVAKELDHLGATRKKVGKALSERIAEVWGDA